MALVIFGDELGDAVATIMQDKFNCFKAYRCIRSYF